jgi:hypothetical protein
MATILRTGTSEESFICTGQRILYLVSHVFSIPLRPSKSISADHVIPVELVEGHIVSDSIENITTDLRNTGPQ